MLKCLLKKSSENVILFPIRGNFESERFSKKKEKKIYNCRSIITSLKKSQTICFGQIKTDLYILEFRIVTFSHELCIIICIILVIFSKFGANFKFRLVKT